MKLLLNKYFLYTITILIILGSGYTFYSVNCKTPLKELSEKIILLENNIQVLGVHLNTCEANNTKQKLDGFIEGIGDINEIPTADFTNLHT